MVGEGFQQGKSAGRQAQRPPAGGNLTPQRVDADAAGLQHAGREAGAGAEMSPYPGQQFLESERLPPVVVGPVIEPLTRSPTRPRALSTRAGTGDPRSRRRSGTCRPSRSGSPRSEITSDMPGWVRRASVSRPRGTHSTV